MGWDLELVDFSLGTQAPSMSNWQAFNDTSAGRLTEVHSDMTLDSSSMRMVVRGTGPIGQFIATVNNISMTGGWVRQATRAFDTCFEPWTHPWLVLGLALLADLHVFTQCRLGRGNLDPGYKDFMQW